ncbi:putative helicase senataxin [Sarcoptes scabiei]|uniref:Putative helicase senataxin n=1 Tax=Sarcoptes scabiei TaxID=52283 RepID=A0A834VFY1_SARSC|nr:putative helicase senataxin [Sarcoptes scabiei]
MMASNKRVEYFETYRIEPNRNEEIPQYGSIFCDSGLKSFDEDQINVESNNQSKSENNSLLGKFENVLDIIGSLSPVNIYKRKHSELDSKKCNLDQPISTNPTNQLTRSNDDNRKNAANSSEIVKKRIRTSVTGEFMRERLQRKRALREKVYLDTKNSNADVRRVDCNDHHRFFGSAFSPTFHSPEKNVSESFVSKNNDESNFFILTILECLTKISDISNIEQIIQVISDTKMRFDPTFKWNDSMLETQLEYKDVSHYHQVMTNLILLETLAQICDDQSSKETSKSEAPISLEKSSDIPFFTIIVGKILVKDFDRSENFEIYNWIVSLELNSMYRILGFVYDISQFNKEQLFVSIKVSKEIYNSFASPISFAKFRLKKLSYIKPAIRLIETLEKLKDSGNFLPLIIKPHYKLCSHEDIDFYTIYNANPKYAFEDNETIPYNRSQICSIEAGMKILHLPYLTKKLLFIQGPPGTGKTHTLIGLLKNILKNINTSEEKPLRIMICAPSNGAVDEIGCRLLDQKKDFLKFRKNFRFVRIGQSSQINKRLQNYDIERIIDNLMRETESFERQDQASRNSLRESYLLTADIILTTLASCQQSSLNVFRKASSRTAIRCLIVDESSQCVEPQLLMPLIYPSISKVILFGDPLQLPATVLSKKAKNINYDRSLFERFYEYFKSTDDQPVITLNEQFRMNSEICQFPSEAFYNSILVTPVGTGINRNIRMHPYFVFDMKDSAEMTLRNKSKSNLIESLFVCKLLWLIFKRIGLNVRPDQVLPYSIGIITFYRGQKTSIFHRLLDYFDGSILKQIQIDTVDGFQGQEKDIIILSCVRASNHVGFVKSKQRMNVALTRAKSLLCICINGKSFSSIAVWRDLLQNAFSRKRLFQIDSEISDQELENILNN